MRTPSPENTTDANQIARTDGAFSEDPSRGIAARLALEVGRAKFESVVPYTETLRTSLFPRGREKSTANRMLWMLTGYALEFKIPNATEGVHDTEAREAS